MLSEPKREEPVDHACSAGRGLGFQDDVATVVEPDFEEQDRHQVPEIDEAEHCHGGGAVRRQIHFERALGMAEMQLQRAAARPAGTRGR